MIRKVMAVLLLSAIPAVAQEDSPPVQYPPGYGQEHPQTGHFRAFGPAVKLVCVRGIFRGDGVGTVAGIGCLQKDGTWRMVD